MSIPEGPLATCLSTAVEMLAATAKWQELCTGAVGGALSCIFIAEVPRRHSPSHSTEIGKRTSPLMDPLEYFRFENLPYAIVHFDDESVASTFTHQATSNHFVSSQSIVTRLFLKPPSDIDPEDRNPVELWVLNTVGRIIRGADAVESPGLLDLSHRGGTLMIRQLDVLGPVYPDPEERAAGNEHIAVELLLQTGIGG